MALHPIHGTAEYPYHALRILKHESQHQVLEVRDSATAKELKMEPGKFYCYYKPSFLNGFEEHIQLDVNFPFL